MNTRPVAEWTDQEVVDFVVNHLKNQKGQAIDNEGGLSQCKYRTPEGKTCAVGCLVPDYVYDERMEGHSISVLADYTNLLRFLGAEVRYSGELANQRAELLAYLQN